LFVYDQTGSILRTSAVEIIIPAHRHTILIGVSICVRCVAIQPIRETKQSVTTANVFGP